MSGRSNRQWQTAALPHELTHVILADCFVGRLVPRWIDEGAALLADPAEKQLRHKAEMAGALADRSAFRVVELLTLEDYPAEQPLGSVLRSKPVAGRISDPAAFDRRLHPLRAIVVRQRL